VKEKLEVSEDIPNQHVKKVCSRKNMALNVADYVDLLHFLAMSRIVKDGDYAKIIYDVINRKYRLRQVVCANIVTQIKYFDFALNQGFSTIGPPMC
jgi:hypothetical protein